MTLLHPGWLFLLILLPFIGLLAVVVAFRHKSRWDAFAAPRLRGALVRHGSRIPRWFAIFFILAGCTALILALSRPQGDAGVRTEKTKGRNILIALDLSRSMRADDVKPDRLGQAKIVIYELLEKLPNDRIGLIGFAGTAHSYAPLTIDHKAVEETVGQIDENWAPVGGSDLSSALKLAIDTLKKTGQKNNALVILSDGEENENARQLDTMIAEAESAGIYIYAIGVGTTQGAYVPNPDLPGGQAEENGQPIISQLQPEVLQKLATETRGRYVNANSGTNIPEMVEAAARNLDSFETESRERRIVIEFFQWVLLPGILFLMISIVSGTRWRALKAAALVMGAFILIPEARANQATDAKEALEAKRFKEARESYRKLAEESSFKSEAARYRIGEGLAAYRGGEYREARGAYSGALLSDDPKISGAGHLGMGNTLFQLGWQGLADQSYPVDPAEVPDLPRFETLVKERLARMKQADEESAGRSEEFRRMDSLMVNWADAVRHYDSSLRLDPSSSAAKQNKETTLIYLRKLRELLEEEKQQADQAMPQQGQGQGEPPQEGQAGEGEENENGSGDNHQHGGGGEGEEQDKDGSGGDKEEDDKKGKNGSADPNESPEERARRLLSDNADLEKGPITQGRAVQRAPKKDW